MEVAGPLGTPLGLAQVDRVTMEIVTLFFGAPKSLQMVISARKSKDAYSLEGQWT